MSRIHDEMPKDEMPKMDEWRINSFTIDISKISIFSRFFDEMVKDEISKMDTEWKKKWLICNFDIENFHFFHAFPSNSEMGEMRKAKKREDEWRNKSRC